MLFSGEHNDGEDELARQKHLDEQSLGNRRIGTQIGAHVKFAGKHARH